MTSAVAALGQVSGAAIDEHATIPIFVAVTASAALIAFAFTVGKGLQKMTTRMDALEETVNDLRQERRDDLEDLRSQLRARSFMEPCQSTTETAFRILLIEDDPNDRKLLRIKLRPAFALDEASTLTEGNKRLAEKEYDCVLLDLNLPDVDIHHTAREFVRRNPDTLCIVLTGSADENTRKAALAQGVDDVWVKGVDDRDLVKLSRRLREAIWKRRRHT